jgi:hypothetical protein
VTAHGRARRDRESRCESVGLLDDVPYSLDKYPKRAGTEAGFSSAAALEVNWRSPRAPLYPGSAKRKLAAVRCDKIHGIARAGPHFNDVPTVGRFHLIPILTVLVQSACPDTKGPLSPHDTPECGRVKGSCSAGGCKTTVNGPLPVRHGGVLHPVGTSEPRWRVCGELLGQAERKH